MNSRPADSLVGRALVARHAYFGMLAGALDSH